MNALLLILWFFIGIGTLVSGDISKVSYGLIWSAYILSIIKIICIEGWTWK